MYNKQQFNKVNDKKVLHKVRKQWVTVSLALLSMIGGGALLTHASVYAEANNNQNNTKQIINQNLQKQRNRAALVQTPNNSTNSRSNSNANLINKRSTTQNITTQAQQLHSHILRDATNASTVGNNGNDFNKNQIENAFKNKLNGLDDVAKGISNSDTNHYNHDRLLYDKIFGIKPSNANNVTPNGPASNSNSSFASLRSSNANVIKNDINSINLDNQNATNNESIADSILNSLNVSANANLNSRKNDYLNQISNDKSIVNSLNSNDASLNDTLSNSSSDLNSEAANANFQISDASKIASDVNNIINSDIKSLESAAKSNSNSNPANNIPNKPNSSDSSASITINLDSSIVVTYASEASNDFADSNLNQNSSYYNEASQDNSIINSASQKINQDSLNPNSINASLANQALQSASVAISNENDVASEANQAIPASPSYNPTSAHNTISHDSAEMNSYRNVINSDLNNFKVQHDSQANSAIQQDSQALTVFANKASNDLLDPNDSTANDANNDLFNANSIFSNVNSLVNSVKNVTPKSSPVNPQPSPNSASISASKAINSDSRAISGLLNQANHDLMDSNLNKNQSYRNNANHDYSIVNSASLTIHNDSLQPNSVDVNLARQELQSANDAVDNENQLVSKADQIKPAPSSYDSTSARNDISHDYAEMTSYRNVINTDLNNSKVKQDSQANSVIQQDSGNLTGFANKVSNDLLNPNDSTANDANNDLQNANSIFSNANSAFNSAKSYKPSAPLSMVTKHWDTATVTFNPDNDEMNVYGGTIKSNDMPKVPFHNNSHDWKLNIQGNITLAKGFKINNDSDLVSIAVNSNVNTKNLSDGNNMFASDQNLENITLDGLDFSKANSVNNMFANDKSLSDISLAGLKCGKSISHMFSKIPHLQRLLQNHAIHWEKNSIKIDLSYVKYANGLFSSDPDLQSVTPSDLNELDLSHVTGYQGDWVNDPIGGANNLFASDPSLTDVNLKGLNLGSTNDVSNMFANDPSLQSVNLDSVNVNKTGGTYMGNEGLDMADMFANDKNLRNISLAGLKCGKSISHMFSKIPHLQRLLQNHAIHWEKNGVEIDLSHTKFANGLFSSDPDLRSVTPSDLNGLNLGNVTGLQGNWVYSPMGGANNLFANDPSLIDVNLKGLNLGSANDVSNMFANDPSLQSVNLDNVDASNAGGTYMNDEITSMADMFTGDKNLRNISLAGLKCGKSISHMFSKIPHLQRLLQNHAIHWEKNGVEIDLSHTKFANGLFSNDPDLRSVTPSDLEGLDFSHVSGTPGNFVAFSIGGANHLFSSDPSLTSVDLSGLNLGSTNDVSNMFANDPNLQDVNLNNVNASTTAGIDTGDPDYESANMADMFANDKNLRNISLAGLKCGGSISHMFSKIPHLQRLLQNHAIHWEKNGVEIDLSHTKFANGLFSSDPDLRSVTPSDLEGLDFSHVSGTPGSFVTFSIGGANHLFSSDPSLTSVDLSGLNLGSANDVSNMFANDPKLNNINFHHFISWNNSNMLSNMKNSKQNIFIKKFKKQLADTINWVIDESSKHANTVHNDTYGTPLGKLMNLYSPTFGKGIHLAGYIKQDTNKYYPLGILSIVNAIKNDSDAGNFYGDAKEQISDGYGGSAATIPGTGLNFETLNKNPKGYWILLTQDSVNNLLNTISTAFSVYDNGLESTIVSFGKNAIKTEMMNSLQNSVTQYENSQEFKNIINSKPYKEIDSYMKQHHTLPTNKNIKDIEKFINDYKKVNKIKKDSSSVTNAYYKCKGDIRNYQEGLTNNKDQITHDNSDFESNIVTLASDVGTSGLLPAAYLFYKNI